MPVSDRRSATRSADSGETNLNRWNGARTAIQGTKRLRDGRIRLSVRLLNAADGKLLYKKIIESDASDQGLNVVGRITGPQLNAILNEPDLSGVELTETDPGWRDQATREFLTAGKAVMDRRTVVDFNRAIDLFEKVIKAEPRSALAKSYLADAHYGRAFVTSDPRDVAASNTSARAAIDLNPTMAEAHTALSRALYQQGRFRESLEEAFTAYELADSDTGRLTTDVANNLRILGDPSRAAAWYRITKTNRPGANEFMVADCLTDLVDDENAAAVYSRVWTLMPERPEGWMGVCRLALLQGDFATARKISAENWTRYRDFAFSEEMAAQVEFFLRNFPEAEKLYQELASKDPNGGGSFYGAVSYQSALGRLRLAAGDERDGSRILEEQLKSELEALGSAPSHPEILYRLAAIESSLGKVEPALEHLRAATEAGWIDYRSLKLDPRFDSISARPEFTKINAKLEKAVQTMQKMYAADSHSLR
jgi:tetratricopeptide (TPR) repeat protein